MTLQRYAQPWQGWARACLILAMCLIFGNGFAQQTYVELILDASGSMWNTLDDGRYRIVAAKDVLSQFVSGLPDGDLNVGLRVYGSQVRATEANACDDTQLFVPLEGVDKSVLTQTIRDTDAIGATPIATSLLAAANDFPTDARTRLIILVTDGEESCGGDLQAINQQLQAMGIEIDLRIIGFDLSPEAAASFSGIGTFENAENAEALAEALDSAVGEVVAEAPPEPDACDEAASLSVNGAITTSYPFTVSFSGPEGSISLYPVGGDAYSSLAYAYTGWGNPAEFTAPTEAGDYELRYVASAGKCVVATQRVSIGASSAQLEAPTSVESGYVFTVPFSGPEGKITIHPADDSEELSDNLGYAYTGWGNPAEFTAPTAEGSYELRYYDTNNTVVARANFSVSASQAGMDVPASVEAGYSFTVPFNGPEGTLQLYKSTDADDSYDSLGYAYTGWGNPATLGAPVQAGEYEVRYYDDNDNVIARKTITVTASQATLQAPASVAAGTAFTVPFSGPEGSLEIYHASDSEGGNDLSYAYTGWGNPAELTAPEAAGNYEIRYYDKPDNGKRGLLLRVPLTVQ